MSKVSSATRPKTANIRSIALLYAGVLLVFAVTQMFSFSYFQTLIESFWLPGGRPAAYLLVDIIVMAEVLALLFLLQIKISTSIRIVSMVLCWIVPTIWVALSLWALLTINVVSNIGFLGTVVTLMPGWWTVFFSLALAVLSSWASWGMWPTIKATKV